MFTNPEKNVAEFGFLPGQAVADFGSGSGHYALALSKALGREGRVYAIDIEKESLLRLKSISEEDGKRNIEIIWGDVEKPQGTRLRDKLADGVVLSNIMFQLTDVPAVLAEAKRILKKDGKLCLVEWSDFSPLSGVHARAGSKVFREKEAKETFVENGFAFHKSFDAGEHHYGMIFKKA